MPDQAPFVPCPTLWLAGRKTMCTEYWPTARQSQNENQMWKIEQRYESRLQDFGEPISMKSHSWSHVHKRAEWEIIVSKGEEEWSYTKARSLHLQSRAFPQSPALT